MASGSLFFRLTFVNEELLCALKVKVTLKTEIILVFLFSLSNRCPRVHHLRCLPGKDGWIWLLHLHKKWTFRGESWCESLCLQSNSWVSLPWRVKPENHASGEGRGSRSFGHANPQERPSTQPLVMLAYHRYIYTSSLRQKVISSGNH